MLHLRYKIDLQRFSHRKYKSGDQVQTLNGFPKLLGDIPGLLSTIGLTIQNPSNILQTLQGEKDLNIQENYQLRLKQN